MNSAKNRAERLADSIRMDSSGSRVEYAWPLATVAGVWGLALACLLPAGCGATRTPPPAQTSQTDQQAKAQSDAARGPQDQTSAATPSASAEPPQPPTGSTAGNAAASAAGRGAEGSEPLVLAPVGPQDARRGSSIAGGGIITEPLRQYFLIQHRYVLDNVKYAVKLYEASEGHKPRSHEEFMTEIIEKNNLELPELQPGWDYYYDAADGELKQRKVQ